MNRRTAFLSALIAMALAPGTGATVIEPGSPGGPTIFVAEDFVFSGGTCHPFDEIISEVDTDGLPAGQLGCLVQDALPIPVPGDPANRLQASTLTLLPVGPTLFRGDVQQYTDFEVSPSDSEPPRASAVPATVFVSVDVKGFLAATLEGRANARAFLKVVDLTGGGAVVGSTTIFDKEVTGTYEPGMSLDAGAILPIPDGKISLGASVSMGGAVELINQKASAILPVLLQRGHQYRVLIEFESRAGVGVGGGVALSGFFAPGGEELLAALPDLFDLVGLGEANPGGFDLLDGFADLLPEPPGGIDTTFISFTDSVPIPGFSIDGFSVPQRSFSEDIPDVSVDGQSASFGDLSLFGGALLIEGSSASVGGFGVTAGQARVQTPAFVFDGFEFPAQKLELPSAIQDFQDLIEQVGLPGFVDQGFSPLALLQWIRSLPAEAIDLGADASPLVDAIVDGLGVEVEHLSVTMEHDVFAVRDGLGGDLDTLRLAVLGGIDGTRAATTDAVMATGDRLGLVIDTSSDTLAELVESESAAFAGMLGDWITLSLRTRIEDNLSAKNATPVASFLLPSASPFQGHLDLVRTIVAETIERWLLAGEDVGHAARQLAHGDGDFARGQYREAFDHYRKAYQAAVK